MTGSGGGEAALLAAFVAATIGCANFQIGGSLPGKVDLWQPPNAPAARGATLAPPAPEPTLVVSPGVLAGTGAREIAGAAEAEAGLGFELGLYWTRVTPDDKALVGDSPDSAGRAPRSVSIWAGPPPSSGPAIAIISRRLMSSCKGVRIFGAWPSVSRSRPANGRARAAGFN